MCMNESLRVRTLDLGQQMENIFPTQANTNGDLIYMISIDLSTERITVKQKRLIRHTYIFINKHQ